MDFFKKIENSGKNLANKIVHFVVLATAIYFAYCRLSRVFRGETEFELGGVFVWLFIAFLLFWSGKNILIWMIIRPISVNGFEPLFKKREIEQLFEDEKFVCPKVFRGTGLEIYESQNWVCIFGHFLRKNESIIIRESSYRGTRSPQSTTTIHVIHCDGNEDHFDIIPLERLINIGCYMPFLDYLEKATGALMIYGMPKDKWENAKSEAQARMAEQSDKKLMFLADPLREAYMEEVRKKYGRWRALKDMNPNKRKPGKHLRR